MPAISPKSRAAALEPIAAGSLPSASARRADAVAIPSGVSTWARFARVAILVLTDLVALLIAASFAYVVWARHVRGQPAWPYLEVLPLVPLFPLAYASGGLYPGLGLGIVETVRRLSLRTSFIFMVLAATSFALRAPQHYSRMAFLIALAVSLVSVPLARGFVLSILRHRSWWSEPAVIAGRDTAHSLDRLRPLISLGYAPVAIIGAGGGGADTVEGIPVIEGVEHASEIARRGVRVLFLVNGLSKVDPTLIGELQQHFRHVIVLRDRADLPVEGVFVRNLGGVLGLEFNNELLKPGNRFVKRTLDIVAATAGMVVAAPIILLSGIAVRLVSKGPLFYRQPREGLLGRRVAVWKLRTMYMDAEDRLRDHLEDNAGAREEWNRNFKLVDDPRVVPFVGTFLRRFSIDELPQLFNVACGEMSLVGPRPFPDYHLAQFPEEFRGLRRLVRPGITGLWQVMVRSDGGIEAQQDLDTYYIRNWSIWMDLYVLARTIGAVISGRGAY